MRVLRIANGKAGKVAEVLVRQLSDRHVEDIGVCVLGHVDAGKSTLVGVLTAGKLDNGRVRTTRNQSHAVRFVSY